MAARREAKWAGCGRGTGRDDSRSAHLDADNPGLKHPMTDLSALTVTTRPYFRPLLRAAAALVAVGVALVAVLALLDTQTAANRLWSALAATLGAAAALANFVLVWRLAQRLEVLDAQAEAAAAQQREVLDAMQAAVVLWGSDGRLVTANRDFRDVYAPIAAHLQPGVRFEDALRTAVAAGLVPEADADTQAWITGRLAMQGSPGTPMLRQLPGGRWRRIVEQRLSDGSLLAHSVDVSDLVAAQAALTLARQDAEQARQRLVDAVDVLPAGFELFDADDRLVMVNRTALAMYPQLHDLVGQRPTFEQVVRTNHARGGLPWVHSEAALDAWLAQRQAERRQPGEPHVYQVDTHCWQRVHERRTREGGVVGVRIDVTEVMEGRAAAERARQQLRDAIDALPEAFALFDADDRLVLCNQRYREVYALSAALIEPGVSFEALLRHGLAHGQYPQARGREDAWLAERMHAHRQPGGPVLQELPDNRWMRIDERQTRDGGIAGVRSEVTELVHREQELTRLNQRLDLLNAELSRLSETDALTGLPNRRQFDRRLAEECSRAARHGMPLALLLFDVDHFKRYNDRHGHPTGDGCLRRVAELLREAARRPTDLVARIGGEEFAMLLPHHTGAEAAAQAERCLAAIETAALPHGDSPVAPHVTLSIGGVQVQAANAEFSPEGLCAEADAALYAAKQAGRRRVVLRG